MDIQNILSIVEDDLIKVEEEFKKNLASRVDLIPTVGEYVLRSGGKRLRPILLLMASKLAGYVGDHQIRLACVVEFIHTATLLHDDVVDSAELRRGLKSANTVWGNEASVLIGDFLYSKSFSIAVSCDKLKLLEVLSDATTDMARGMVFELIKTNDIETTEEDYIRIIVDKTAVLIAAACQLAGIIGDVSPEKEEALREYGMNLGIAFQLMDDSMDYISNEEDFGKTIGTDLQEGKVTLPIIKTLRECSDEEKASIKRILGSENICKDDLESVLSVINKYGGIEYTIEKARDYISKAKNNLSLFEDSPIKETLLDMANYVIEREN